MAFVFALLGAVLFWCARDDDTEQIGPISLGSGKWKAIIFVLAAALMWPGWEGLAAYVLALVLFAYVLTGVHNWLLSPPTTQILGEPRDFIQTALMDVFNRYKGQIIGHPLYWTFSAIRYALPIAFMGALVGNVWLMISGPIVSIIYYPWEHSERFKYWRAALTGGVVFGAMVAGAGFEPATWPL